MRVRGEVDPGVEIAAVSLGPEEVLEGDGDVGDVCAECAPASSSL